MSSLIACAPCCWGVEFADNPYNPDWMQVLNEAKKAGFSGLELGPYGFIPLDANVVNMALASIDLKIFAGTIFEPLSDVNSQVGIVNKTKKLCAFLQQIGADKLVVIDCVNDIRSQFAGLDDLAPRLSSSQWLVMIDTIRQISAIAKRFDIRAVVHPHAGGYIEYADEIDRILADVSHSEVGLCLDTGHLYYAGMDPAYSLKKYAKRLDYVHFKDINPIVLQHSIESRVGFWQACADGVMCPIGEGSVDYDAVQQALTEIGYKGWITIEQERDPRHSATTLADITRSCNYLAQRGFG